MARSGMFGTHASGVLSLFSVRTPPACLSFVFWRAIPKSHHSIHHVGGLCALSLSCTTPFPVLRFLAETGVNWIVFNVGKRIVKMKQSVLHGAGQLVIAKKTAAVTAIEKSLDSPAPFEVGFLWRSCLELIAPTCEHGLWQ